jgi:hypothetical protein
MSEVGSYHNTNINSTIACWGQKILLICPVQTMIRWMVHLYHLIMIGTDCLSVITGFEIFPKKHGLISTWKNG